MALENRLKIIRNRYFLPTILSFVLIFLFGSFSVACENKQVEAAYGLVAGISHADKSSLCQIVMKRSLIYKNFRAQNFAFVLQNTQYFRNIGDTSGKSTLLSILLLTSGFGRDEQDLKNIRSLQRNTNGCMTIEALGMDMTASLGQNGAEFKKMVSKWDHDFFLKYALMDMYQLHTECRVQE